MFYGHIGVALAAKPLAPKLSVGVMLVAATTIDILCGIFTIFGLEWVNTATGECYLAWSHGLFMSVVWSLLALGISWLVTRNQRMSFVIAGLIFSHWILDFISHPMGMGRILPKDLPLFFEGSPKVGLGLYTYIVPAFITEFGILFSGVFIYLRSSRPKDRTGQLAFALLMIFLALFPLTMLLPQRLSFIATFVTLFFLPIGIWMEQHRNFISLRRKKEINYIH